MNRVLAIDYGSSRIGLALSDPLKILATPFEVWENEGKDKVYAKLDGLIIQKKIDTIVIGLPKNMDGSEGYQVKEVKKFFENFKNSNIDKIVYVDERLSSVEATKILHEKGIPEKDQRGIKDAYAASVFLKEYLEYGV